jgi:hypothetical protein
VTRRFVSRPIEPAAGSLDTSALERGEPALPGTFMWDGETIAVGRVLRTWRSTKVDRGDAYLDRHWFEFETPDGAVATVYFHRRAQRGAARWWLYTIER